MADSDQPKDDRATVIMRASLRGHRAGQTRRVAPNVAAFLVANKHADLPKSKQ